jgi:hypothetical protein
MQMIHEIQYEKELILQKLAEPEKHPQHAKPVSKYKEPTMTLASVLNNAEDQATTQGFSQKKKWLLLAEHLEEAHRLGIYNHPVNTICRFLCLIYCGVKPNTIRKALSEKYKDPHQSKIAHQQPKGLTASIYRYHKQRMKAKNAEYLYEQNPLDGSVSSSVTPYKDLPRNRHSFARWLQRSKRKEYNTGIFSKLKKDRALVFCEYPDPEFALLYIQKAYHTSEKELSTVHRAMKKYEQLNQ